MTEKVMLLLERVIVTGMFLAFITALILTGHLPAEWVSGVWGLIMLIAYAWFTVHTSQVNASNQVNQTPSAPISNTPAEPAIINGKTVQAARNADNVQKVPPGMGV